MDRARKRYHHGGMSEDDKRDYRNDRSTDDDNIVSLSEAARKRRHHTGNDNSPPPPPHEPMINLPPVTKYAVAFLVLVHLGLAFGVDDVTRYWVFEHFGFVAGGYTGAAPLPWWSLVLGPLTYMALHGSWMHLGMNGAMMVAFGAGCERWMGGRRLFVLFVLCGLVSALVQFAYAPQSTDPVIGASGGLSGMFAAVLVMLQQRGLGGRGRYGIWPFVFLWIGISVLFGTMGAPDGSVVAWPAHIGGFLAGFIFIGPVMRFVR